MSRPRLYNSSQWKHVLAEDHIRSLLSLPAGRTAQALKLLAAAMRVVGEARRAVGARRRRDGMVVRCLLGRSFWGVRAGSM